MLGDFEPAVDGAMAEGNDGPIPWLDLIGGRLGPAHDGQTWPMTVRANHIMKKEKRGRPNLWHCGSI